MGPGTDEQFPEELESIRQRYAQKMKEATAYLQEAQQAHAAMKAHYTACTDFERVEQLCTRIQSEIGAPVSEYHD